MSNTSEGSHACTSQPRYKGVRQRKWGKWVSEIRVPGTQDRLWLGTYKTPEGAAVARDIAYYCLRGSSCMDKLNFPLMLLPNSAQDAKSPRSIQNVASDAGMAIDAQLIEKMAEGERWAGFDSNGGSRGRSDHVYGEEYLDISVDDYL